MMGKQRRFNGVLWLATTFATGSTGQTPSPPLFCSASSVLVRPDGSVRLLADTEDPANRGPIHWVVTAGHIEGTGGSVTWSLKGASSEKNSQTARAFIDRQSENNSICSVEVWLAPDGGIRGPSLEYGRAFLVRSQNEDQDLGLYSYLILGSPVTDENRARYEGAIKAYLEMLNPIAALRKYVKQGTLDALYLPVKQAPPPNFSKQDIQQQVDWVLKTYDFPRVRGLLQQMGGGRRDGPYLIATGAPLPSNAITVELDMSRVPGDVARSWVREFLSMSARERSWTAQTAQNFTLRARTLLALLAQDTPSIREALQGWVKLYRDSSGSGR